MHLSTLWRCGGTARTFACNDNIQWSIANPHRLTFTFCAPHSQPRCASRSRFLRSAGTQHLKDTPHISHTSSTCQAGKRGYSPGQPDQLDNRSSSIFSPIGTALLHTICLEDVSRVSKLFPMFSLCPMHHFVHVELVPRGDSNRNHAGQADARWFQLH